MQRLGVPAERDLCGAGLPELPLPGDRLGESSSELRPTVFPAVAGPRQSPLLTGEVAGCNDPPLPLSPHLQVVRAAAPHSSTLSTREARALVACSPYGDLSLLCYHLQREGEWGCRCSGSVSEWGGEVPPALLNRPLGAAQVQAPRRWGVVRGDAGGDDDPPLPSAKELGYIHTPLELITPEELRELCVQMDTLRCGLRRPQGYEAGVICPGGAWGQAPRVINASHGDHPMWDAAPEGTPLDFIELEVRYNGETPLEAAAVLIGGEEGHHIGTVSPLKRWWLNEARYPCCLHVLRCADSTGGFHTICAHLSQLPSQCAALYVTVHGPMDGVDALCCIVSSRNGGPDGKDLRQQYCCRALRTPQSTSRGVVLIRISRAPNGWSVGAIDTASPTAETPAQLLPAVHNDYAQWLRTGPRPLPTDAKGNTRSVVAPLLGGITTEEMFNALGKGCRADVAQRLAVMFNHFDKDDSKSLSVRELADIVEELYWVRGMNPPPAQVIMSRAERMLQSIGLSKRDRVSLKQFGHIVGCDYFRELAFDVPPSDDSGFCR
eukprot:TRINITY_DN47349_c0_g1_i1.p1 TRINITY_DN47349_c0_g1~~TRINITY_DN47349_c0_g1_i1.p1  ORF type:complete len:549 (+),score=138.96 TRINITY_DN47349_c0_g1_i1:71-1717(+)